MKKKSKLIKLLPELKLIKLLPELQSLKLLPKVKKPKLLQALEGSTLKEKIVLFYYIFLIAFFTSPVWLFIPLVIVTLTGPFSIPILFLLWKGLKWLVRQFYKWGEERDAHFKSMGYTHKVSRYNMGGGRGRNRGYSATYYRNEKL